MWEFELIADRSFITYIKKLNLSMAEVIKSSQAVSALMADELNIYLSFGANVEMEPKVKAKLRILLCELFTVDVKKDFISKRISIKNSLTEEILVLLCTYFDREIERSIVLQLLDLSTTKMNVNSFFAFKLSSLQKKWEEFCELINKNIPLLDNPTNYSELTKFLLCSIDKKCDSVILDLKNRCLVYHDLRSNTDMFDLVDSKSVFAQLIDLNPSLITVKNSKTNPRIVNQLKKVFGTRLVKR